MQRVHSEFSIRVQSGVQIRNSTCFKDFTFACLVHSSLRTLSIVQNGYTIFETSGKLAADSSISCRHSFCYLGPLSNCLGWMQNFVLYRLVTDRRGVVDQKVGVWTEKPYEIHDFHSNPCTHSHENLGLPSELHRSTPNFMLYRLVTDSKGFVDQKVGVWAEKPYEISYFRRNPCRHSFENLG